MTGYRHAVSLLLTSRLRSLPFDCPPAVLSDALTMLARDLVALGDDMRVLPDQAEWTAREFSSAVERARTLFAHRSDGDLADVFEHARTRGVEILSEIGEHRAPDSRRDLFL